MDVLKAWCNQFLLWMYFGQERKPERMLARISRSIHWLDVLCGLSLVVVFAQTTLIQADLELAQKWWGIGAVAVVILVLAVLAFFLRNQAISIVYELSEWILRCNNALRMTDDAQTVQAIRDREWEEVGRQEVSLRRAYPFIRRFKQLLDENTDVLITQGKLLVREFPKTFPLTESFFQNYAVEEIAMLEKYNEAEQEFFVWLSDLLLFEEQVKKMQLLRSIFELGLRSRITTEVSEVLEWRKVQFLDIQSRVETLEYKDIFNFHFPQVLEQVVKIKSILKFLVKSITLLFAEKRSVEEQTILGQFLLENPQEVLLIIEAAKRLR